MLSTTACPVESVTDLLGAAGALVFGASCCPHPIIPTITTAQTIIASQPPRLFISLPSEKEAYPLFSSLPCVCLLDCKLGCFFNERQLIEMFLFQSTRN